jgi:hypothetical protein
MTRLRKLWLIAGAFGALVAATDLTPSVSVNFERDARALATGRSPKFLVHGAHGLLMLSVRPAANGGGQDLYFEASGDGGDTFSDPLRVNQVTGEVSDHGENSPLLAASPDSRYLYAVWGARDPRSAMGGTIRFSRSARMRPSFSPALTVNDDDLPVSHSFQNVGVGPDGTVYVAWLDGRDKSAAPGQHGSGHAGHGNMEGTSSIYLARSTDNGQTFEKNVRVAGNICPCCRPTFTFVDDTVVLGWRSVEPGDLRDIFIASSSDKGRTWSQPALVARDGWKINGCPHVGPALATLKSRVYAAWFTEGSGDPAINLAFSDDGGKTFSGKRKVSGDTMDPTHPHMVSDGEKLALVFQARSATKDQGWGRVGVYYREVYPDGSMSNLVRAGEGQANANYPTVALGLSGRIFIGWTQTVKGVPTALLVRGRSAAKATK